MAPEVSLLDEGESDPQKSPIDPLAKFNKVLKVISDIYQRPKNMTILPVKKLSHNTHQLLCLIKKA